ncbi:MAG: exodeoxyribonuclease VII large subunit [Desulfobacteraceae bacterium 4572_88]|nr:MAG: exodeoxyribonuclease VII large subunit [Desulfobacteraceae bacterium 4572_88]
MTQRIYTVSELTGEIMNLLEDNFPCVWISGEISDSHMAASKHFYFTLRDEQCRIPAVMFRGQNRNLKFEPENGMHITGLGRINVYKPRGAYQLVFEYLEPAGVGALQTAFEQLRARLGDEGLFDQKHKKPLPFFPGKIAVITSPAGAVVHDILNVIDRRFPNIHIEIIPVRVQGEEAAGEIAAAIALLNRRGNADVAILARGGGSLEDLQAFNSEKVARAIFASDIPIISAVGHETDFSIADFAADLRAPTPSAAAELAVPMKADLLRDCEKLSERLRKRFRRYAEERRMLLDEMAKRLIHPGKRIADLRIRSNDLTRRLTRTFAKGIRQKREQLLWRKDRLKALNPEAILSRGYSITRTMPKGRVLKNAASVTKGQKLEVMLAKGTLICRVEEEGNG